MSDYIPEDQQLAYALDGDLRQFKYTPAVDALIQLATSRQNVMPEMYPLGEARLGDFEGKGLLFEHSQRLQMHARMNLDAHVFHGVSRRGIHPEQSGIFIALDVFEGLSDEARKEAMTSLPHEMTFTGPVFPITPNMEDNGYRAEDRAISVKVAAHALHSKYLPDGQVRHVYFARLIPLR